MAIKRQVGFGVSVYRVHLEIKCWLHLSLHQALRAPFSPDSAMLKTVVLISSASASTLTPSSPIRFPKTRRRQRKTGPEPKQNSHCLRVKSMFLTDALLLSALASALTPSLPIRLPATTNGFCHKVQHRKQVDIAYWPTSESESLCCS